MSCQKWKYNVLYTHFKLLVTTRNKFASDTMEFKADKRLGLFGRKKDVIKVPDETLPKANKKDETREEALQRERVKRELEL
jgi:hypothetical protein